MSKLQNVLAKTKNIASKPALAGSLIVASAGAFADPTATQTAITAAFDSAQANVGLAVGGLIALVALVVGVTLLMGLFKRA